MSELEVSNIMSVGLAALTVVLFQFFVTPTLSRLFYNEALAKNPAHVRSDSNFRSEHPFKSMAWIHRGLGALLLAVIGAGLVREQFDWMYTVQATSTKILLLQLFLIDIPRNRKLKKIIPPLPKREATLIPRSISRLCPPQLFITWLVSSVVLMGGALYVWLLNSQLTSSLSLALVAIPLILGALYYSVYRKPFGGSLEFSERIRRLEIGFTLTVAILVNTGGVLSLVLACMKIENYNFWLMSSIKLTALLMLAGSLLTSTYKKLSSQPDF